MTGHEQNETKNPVPEHLDECRRILFKYSIIDKGDNHMVGEAEKFSVEELKTIVLVWDRLEPEVQNLALFAYPEIARALLRSRLDGYGF